MKYENSLATKHPELAAEWNYARNGDLTPQTVAPQSNKRVWWICDKGHEWPAVIADRSSKGNGCPYCSGRRPIVGETDLASQNPELAAEWNYARNGELTPQTVSRTSNKKVWWRCGRCGHEWPAKVSNRSVNGAGCSECNKERFTSFPEQAILYYLKKVTVAESRNTELGKEIDIYLPELCAGIEHNGKYYHPNKEKDAKKVAFFAKKNIRIITVYGCRQFQQNRVQEDVIEYIYHVTNRDSLNWAIATIFQLLQISPPDIDVEADEAEINAQYIRLEKENSLAVKHPELVAEWHPTRNGCLTPEKVSHGSERKIWWQCDKGHEWQARIADRSDGCGCPYCSHHRVLSGDNDLATTNPELAAEWNYARNGELTPQTVVGGGIKKVWWLCGKCGHEWPATIDNRVRGRNCPICAKRKGWETRRTRKGQEAAP